jgi:PadR family transcriptional regulator
MESGVSPRTAILMALIQGKGYGLELIDRVKAKTRGSVVLHQGSVYPLLRDLEADGFLKSWNESGGDERGGRPRRFYELTAEGRRAAFDEKKTLTALLTFAEVG